MKKLFLILASLCLPLTAAAQNWTTVSATNITDLNQQKLANGQLCFLATDQNDVPISFNVGGGGQVLRRPFCSPVSAGVVTTFSVPNPATTTPAGIYYRVIAKDVATGQEVLRYSQVTFNGATFNFDNYAPVNIGVFSPPVGTAVSGNLTVNGNLSVTGSQNAGLFTVAGLGINGVTASTNTINGPSGWSLQASGTTVETLTTTGASFSSITATQLTSTGLVSASGNAGLPASMSIPILAGGFGTPIAARMFFGDGTGWKFKFSKRSASVTTDLFGFTDLGAFTFGAADDAGLSRAAASTLALGNGTAGDASGTLKLAALNNGGTLTLPVSTDTLVGRATTDTLTNKTIDAEAAGNTISLPLYVQVPAASCNNATASNNWDLPAANAPVPTCLTGTNSQQATADFDDTAARTMQTAFILPPGWTGNVDVDIYWLVAAGGGASTVKFTIATACSASAASFDPAFNTANTVTSGTVGANNAINITSQTAITMTGCAPGNLLHIKFGRDNTDTSTATVKVLDVAFTIRRSM